MAKGDIVLINFPFTDLTGSKLRTSKLATLDKNLARGLLGGLIPSEMQELDGKLKILLQLK
jgi:mRNA interferase MazF